MECAEELLYCRQSVPGCRVLLDVASRNAAAVPITASVVTRLDKETLHPPNPDPGAWIVNRRPRSGTGQHAPWFASYACLSQVLGQYALSEFEALSRPAADRISFIMDDPPSHMPWPLDCLTGFGHHGEGRPNV
jgi:hypothetical protein